jgi:alpha-galactosidase
MNRLRKCFIISVVLPGMLTYAVTAKAGDPPFYVKKATWHETAKASRDALAQYKQGELSRANVHLGPWSWIGPFTSDAPYAESFPPEQEIVPGKTYADGRLRWVVKTEWNDGVVTNFEPVEKSANYVYRLVTGVKDTTLTAFLGSDDGIKVWVNGTLVFQHNIDRGCGPNQDTAALPLRKGENRLLLKISNGGGPTAFFFSLLDVDPGTIWKLIGRDFSAPEARQEIEWERRDEIWTGDWPAGDYSLLGKRYVSAYGRLAESLGMTAVQDPGDVRSRPDLDRVRSAYIGLRREEGEFHRKEMVNLTLTPKPSSKPRINGPKVYGVRPGAPFLFTIAATGDRPMEFQAKALPRGLALDPATGRITGALAERGEHVVTLRVRNALGTAERHLKIVVGDRIALTPPLGWNSWNCFAGDVDDAKVRSAADAMVRSGLVDHGWTYINIDDCWMIKPESDNPLLRGERRDRDGMINTNRKFPDMKSLSDYVHGKGLKLGIYSSPGPLTCAGFTASYRFEGHDARRFAGWGIDYLKYDWCSYGSIAKDRSLPELKKPYRIMRAALDSVRRDIVYSLCQYGMGDVWEWGTEVGGNCWRTTGDIEDTWESMSGIGFKQAGYERFAGPGHWNDPDMLVVGYVGWGPQLHPTRLTPHEQRTHITLWSLLASPLLIGCDMTRLDDFTLNLLTNDEVLDVNQDPLGKQAGRARKAGDLEVWVKDMEDGSKAVGLFNLGPREAKVAVRWSDIGISGRRVVRDLWQQKDLGAFEEEFSVPVARHGAMLVRVLPPH